MHAPVSICLRGEEMSPFLLPLAPYSGSVFDDPTSSPQFGTQSFIFAPLGPRLRSVWGTRLYLQNFIYHCDAVGAFFPLPELQGICQESHHLNQGEPFTSKGDCVLEDALQAAESSRNVRIPCYPDVPQ